MKKALFILALFGLLVSCSTPADTPEPQKPAKKETSTIQLGKTTKTTLQKLEGKPVSTVDTILDVTLKDWENMVINQVSPYYIGEPPTIEVLKYAGETEDEVCRLYVFLNNKLAGHIVLYNKNSVQYTNALTSYMDTTDVTFVEIGIQKIFDKLGFSTINLDEDHAYLRPWLESSIFIAQPESYDPETTNVEEWLKTANGYNLVVYGGLPAPDANHDYSMLTYVDVLAVYEFSKFADVYGFLDIVLDMTF